MDADRHLYPAQLEGYSKSFSSSYQLGTSYDHNKLFVTTPRKMFGSKPILVVHDGADENAPQLAYVSKESTFSSGNIVHVPKGPSGPVEVYFKPNCTSDGGWKNVIHRFSMNVDPVGRTEDFEWRMVHDGAIKNYGSYGFQLRRVTSGADDAVAYLGLGKWSLHKKFTFSLVGDALSLQFGTAWEAVALATALRTYLLEEERLAVVATST